MPIGFAGWALIANTATNAYTAKRSADAAERQMEFQQEQSETQHVRAVNDLRAAGLNPILAAHTGNQAMSGAMPTQFPSMEPAVSSALQGRRLQSELKVIEQAERKTKAEADRAESEADITDFERRVVDALRHNFKESGVEVEARRRLEASKAGATASAIERELDESSGELFRTLNRLGVSGSTATQLIRSLRR